MKASWLRHVELLRENDLCELWFLVGIHGVGKTATLNGMIDELRSNGFSVTGQFEPDHDIAFIDDAGKKFSKRYWNSELGKDLSLLMQIVRTLYTLIIITIPEKEMLDKSVRESLLGIEIEVKAPGFARWRDPIIVKPRWNDESWRVPYLERIKKHFEE